MYKCEALKCEALCITCIRNNQTWMTTSLLTIGKLEKKTLFALQLRKYLTKFRVIGSLLSKISHSYPALGSTAIALGLSRLFHIRVLRFFPSILETQISWKSQSVQYNFFDTQSTARPSSLPKSPDTMICGLHEVFNEQLNIFRSEKSLQNISSPVYKKSTATAASVVDTITRSFSELFLFVHNNRTSFWLA